MDQPGADRQVLAELTTLAEELLEQASEIRRQWSDLGDALGIDLGELPDASEPAAVPQMPAAAASAEAAESDPVRLVALDMMLSGRSRDEVEEYLRATFGDGVDVGVVADVFTSDQA